MIILEIIFFCIEERGLLYNNLPQVSNILSMLDIRDNVTSEPVQREMVKRRKKFPLKRDENLCSLVGLMELRLAHQVSRFYLPQVIMHACVHRWLMADIIEMCFPR